MKFHEKLADCLGRRRMTQRALARALAGADDGSLRNWVNTINRWVNGKGGPDIAEGLMIARALDVPLEYLADDALDAPPGSPDATTEDERAVLMLVRALGLDAEEAMRRLAGVPVVTAPRMPGVVGPGCESIPMTG